MAKKAGGCFVGCRAGAHEKNFNVDAINMQCVSEQGGAS